MTNYYNEYTIRCKTCFEPIASKSKLYERLLSTGMTTEEALNELKIMMPCSRICMMNPTPVYYNMENRGVVEGTVSIESAITELFDTSMHDSSKSTALSFKSCGIEDYEYETEEQERREAELELLGVSSKEAPRGADVLGFNIDDLGEGISLDDISAAIEKMPQKQRVPKFVGIPEINSKPKANNTRVHVGAGMYSEVLQGRTYLAR